MEEEGMGGWDEWVNEMEWMKEEGMGRWDEWVNEMEWMKKKDWNDGRMK